MRAERVRGRVVTAEVPADSLGEGVFCAGSLSVRESFTRWLDVPFSSGGKARKVLPTVLDIELPFALEECIYDIVRIVPNNGNTRALAVGARTVDVQARINGYRSAGFDIRVLDQDGLALWEQALSEFPVEASESERPRIVVDLASERSTIVIGYGEQFISAHGVGTSDGGRVNRLLGVALKGRGVGKPRWIFAGSRAVDREAARAFVGIAGEQFDGEPELADRPGLFLARAIATRCLNDSSLKTNLRAGVLAHPEMLTAMKRKALAPVLLFSMAGLLLMGINVAGMTFMRARERSIDRAFNKLASETAGFPVTAKGAHALAQVRKKVDERSAVMQPLLMAFSRSLTAVIHDVISAGKESGLDFEVVSIDKVADDNDGGGHILIKGTASEWSGCDGLIRILRNSGYKPVIQRSDALANERIPFTIRSGGRDGR